MFKEFVGKPVTRIAHEIVEGDIIKKVDEKTSTLNGVEFKHYGKVSVGDYVIRNAGECDYHCTKDIFVERNYITEKVSGLTFGEAIEAAKEGKKIARAGWNGKGMFVVFMPGLQLPAYNTADTARKVNDRTAKWIGEDQPLDCQPYFAMYNAQKQWIPGWAATQSDMLDEDWCVVE